MARSNEAMIIVGRKHTGKSTLGYKIITEYIKNNPDKRGLVINVNGSPAYNKIPYISYHGMTMWKKGLYQFYDQDHEKMFDFLLRAFDPPRPGNTNKGRLFNGMILMEDCTKYISSNPSKEIKTFLVDHRMWNADMIFTFHALSRVPPFFWDMTTRIILLKTQDVIDSTYRKIPNWKSMSAAHERVMNHSDNYYHEVVSTLI